VADRCRLDPGILRPLLEQLRRDRTAASGRPRTPARPDPDRTPPPDQPPSSRVNGGRRPGPAPGFPEREAQRPGLEALRLAVHRPEAVAGRLDPRLFADERQRAAYETLHQAGDLHKAIEVAGRQLPEVAALLRRLAVEEPAADADDVVVQLVWIASRRALADLESAARLSPEAVGELAPVAARVRRDVQELDRDVQDSKERETAIAAADRLLAWLVERGEES